LVEKTAELGVSRLLWVRTSRTEGRPPAADKARGWAIAALEQSRGAWMVEMGTTDLMDLDPEDLIVADPDGADQPPSGRLTLLVGPEGGLAPEEIPPGSALLSLGPTVLRVETAAVAATCALIRRRAPSVEH
jgi:RsmE family RNA methyltransferase